MRPLTRRGKELARLRKENALLRRRLLEYAADPAKGERLCEELAAFGITRDSVADYDKQWPSLECSDYEEPRLCLHPNATISVEENGIYRASCPDCPAWAVSVNDRPALAPWVFPLSRSNAGSSTPLPGR